MTYDELLERVAADRHVVGLVLTGSRGHGPFVRDGSDWDVRLVVADDAPSGHVGRYPMEHGSDVEVVAMPLRDFTAAGAIGTDTEWDRYSYVHATLVVDKLGGRIAEILGGKQSLAADVARRIAAAALGDYINSWYRSLKSAALGLDLESRLDAAESVGPLLTTLFALHGRVRPFNKFLGWELREHPLPGLSWSADRLLPRLRAILETGSVPEQAALFRDLEDLARAHGHAEEVDSWEPDVDWLRSGIEA